MRTLLAKYFVPVNAKRDFSYFENYVLLAISPKPTNENCHVCLVKVLRSNFSRADYFNFAKFMIASSEYVKTHGYVDGLHIIFDLSGSNVMELCLNIDLVITKEGLSILLEGYGHRIRSLHIICESSLINTFVNIVKALIGLKLSQRIFVHKKVTELHDYVDKKILPKEFGGEERSMREIFDLWLKALSTEENLKHLEEISGFCTDETYRSEDNFSEVHAGMAGTFRALHVD